MTNSVERALHPSNLSGSSPPVAECGNIGDSIGDIA